jgi:hypothetical protein
VRACRLQSRRLCLCSACRLPHYQCAVAVRGSANPIIRKRHFGEWCTCYIDVAPGDEGHSELDCDGCDVSTLKGPDVDDAAGSRPYSTAHVDGDQPSSLHAARTHHSTRASQQARESKRKCRNRRSRHDAYHRSGNEAGRAEARPP